MKKLIIAILALMAGMAHANLVDLPIFVSSSTLEAWPATVKDLKAVGAFQGEEIVIDNVLNLTCANRTWAEVCKDRAELNKLFRERNRKLRNAFTLPKEVFRMIAQEGMYLPVPTGFVKVAFPNQAMDIIAASAVVTVASAPTTQAAVSPEVGLALKALGAQSTEARAQAMAAVDAAKKAATDGREARSIAGDAKSLASTAQTAAVNASAFAASASVLALGGAEMARQAKAQALTAETASAEAVKATEDLTQKVSKLKRHEPWLIALSAAAVLSILAIIGMGFWNLHQRRQLQGLAGPTNRNDDEVNAKLFGLRKQVLDEVRPIAEAAEGKAAQALMKAEVAEGKAAQALMKAEVAQGNFDSHEQKLKATKGWVVLPADFKVELAKLIKDEDAYHPCIKVTDELGEEKMYWIEIKLHSNKGAEWFLVNGIERLTEVKAANLITSLNRSGGFGGGKNHYINFEAPDRKEERPAEKADTDLFIDILPSPVVAVSGRAEPELGTMGTAVKEKAEPVLSTMVKVVKGVPEIHGRKAAMPSQDRIDRLTVHKKVSTK